MPYMENEINENTSVKNEKELLGHLLFMTTMLKHKMIESDFMFDENYKVVEEDIKKMESKISSILSSLTNNTKLIDEEFNKYISLVKERQEIEDKIFSLDK